MSIACPAIHERQRDPEMSTAWIVGTLALAMVAGAILVCIVLGSGAP